MKKLNKLILIWNLLKINREKYLFLLLFFMFITALGEVVPIFFIKPLIVNISSTNIENGIFINKIFSVFDDNTKTILLASIIIFFLFLLNLARILNNWFIARFSASAGTLIGKKIFSKYILIKYLNYEIDDSSLIISALSTHLTTAVTSFINILKIILSSFICLFIVISLLAVNFKLNLTAILLFATSYLISYELIKKTLKDNSIIIKNKTQEQVKVIKDSIGIQRDIISNNLHRYYKDSFLDADWPIRRARGDNFALKLLPRSIIEFFAFSFTICVALFLSIKNGENVLLFSYIGTLAFGIQRLMPSMQTIFSSFAYIVGESASIDNINYLLKNKNKIQFNYFKHPKKINFEYLELIDTSFKYINKNSKYILKNTFLKINKGDKIAIFGESGSGKSTLIDLISTIAKPSSGNLKINEQNIHSEKNENLLIDWRNSISFVPQTPFLVNKTIIENIALGSNIENIDKSKVLNASKNAFIHEYINSLKNGYYTKIGERGINLSGGQMQRIALARAFYKENNFLILDESTNSLDKKTEYKIIKNITSTKNNKTVICITHNFELLKNFSRIIRVEKGKVLEQSF